MGTCAKIRAMSAEGWAALAGFLAALLSALALLEVRRVQRNEQRIRLTAVSAWAEPILGGPIDQVGVRVTVRNDTNSALQLPRVIVRPRFERPTATAPGEVQYGMSTFDVPLVRPQSTSAFVIPGPMFLAWRGQSPLIFVVAVLFQDALGDWWWKQPNGRLYRNRMPLRIPGSLPDIDQAMKLSVAGLLASWRRRGAAWAKKLLQGLRTRTDGPN